MEQVFGTKGKHVLFDIYGVDPEVLNDNIKLKNIYKEGIIKAGADIRRYQEELFEPVGLTFTFILSESHASCHTYPPQTCLMGCIHTCGEHVNPEIAVDYIIEQLQPDPNRIYRQTIIRGVE